jgi:hypothetical protein
MLIQKLAAKSLARLDRSLLLVQKLAVTTMQMDRFVCFIAPTSCDLLSKHLQHQVGT